MHHAFKDQKKKQHKKATSS